MEILNWQSRMVHPHPRQVNRAHSFDSQPSVQAKRQDTEILLAKIARGDDVTPHLSRDVEVGYCLRKPDRKHGPDFDLLLNEWGIHHLHLGESSEDGGRMRQSSELLFVIFGKGVAFVLAVGLHRAWASRRLIEATVRSWPDQRLFVAFGIPPGQDSTEDEHVALRKAGITTAALADGKVWFSAVSCGISTALVSNRVVNDTGRILRCVHGATERPECVVDQLRNLAASNRVAWPSDPIANFRWLSGPDSYCFGFVEETSGAALLL